jgi:hypothetical protein
VPGSTGRGRVVTEPVAYRIYDEQPEDTRWTPNVRAFGLFVAVVFLLLSMPTLDNPLWLRVGKGIVVFAAWLGIEVGPLTF